MTDHDLQLKACALRRSMLRIIVNAGAGHTGGGLSCLDILNVLYNRVLNVSPQTFTSPTRDRYVQSKGHCVEALYRALLAVRARAAGPLCLGGGGGDGGGSGALEPPMGANPSPLHLRSLTDPQSTHHPNPRSTHSP